MRHQKSLLTCESERIQVFNSEQVNPSVAQVEFLDHKEQFSISAIFPDEISYSKKSEYFLNQTSYSYSDHFELEIENLKK
jgi:hypothetical protein